MNGMKDAEIGRGKKTFGTNQISPKMTQITYVVKCGRITQTHLLCKKYRFGMPQWVQRIRQKRAAAKKLKQNQMSRALATWNRIEKNPDSPSVFAQRALRKEPIGRRAARKEMIEMATSLNRLVFPVPAKYTGANIEEIARAAEAAELNKKRGKGKNSHYKLTGLGKKQQAK